MDGNAQTIIVEGQYQRLTYVQGYPIRFSSNVSDLGELLDDQLKMLGHSLTVDSKKTLVNAFVASCLDFCNSLCHGFGDQGSTGRVQIAAVRFVSSEIRPYISGSSCSAWRIQMGPLGHAPFGQKN